MNPTASTPRGFLSAILGTLALALLPMKAQGAWAPKTSPLKTRWTSQVSPLNALPEYPRPQLVREKWQNLNGEWQFANAAAGEAPPFGRNLAESILVPFPVESALSGIMRKQERMWYRRLFTIPQAWNGQRVILNFGAVDNEATVYVNGKLVGTHKGGYDSFSFDISSQLQTGSNEIIVGAYDPTTNSENPVGKQVNNPSGIWYTSSSGIWQTVWLEPVPVAHITSLKLTPKLDEQVLGVVVNADGINGQYVEAVAFSSGVEVGRATGAAGAELSIPVANPRLWTPEDPYLYDLRITVRGSNQVIDQVNSYFGMRSIGLATVDGFLRTVLNGKFVFQIGTLDQGFWPDGIYTAPTDAALRFDIEKHKELGFNMVRKHIKVEPARWFYWADRLGLMVWQDMPSMKSDIVPSDGAKVQFEKELRELIAEHQTAPSIVMWVNQNEGWGQHDQAKMAALVKSLDPTRLVNNMSGVNCCGAKDGGNGDVVDWHSYVEPHGPQASVNRAAVIGEFGGLGLKIQNHMWDPASAFSYEMLPDIATVSKRYAGMMTQNISNMKYSGLNAAVYTEIVDVENEVNGFLTYDRAVMKVDTTIVRNANQGLVDASRVSEGIFALGRTQSLQVVTPGYTDRYLRHFNSLATTESIAAGSATLLKQDASFKVVRGLADGSCYSFESLNFPGTFLRHIAFRISKADNDGSAVFKADATFCARAGLDGSGNVSLESLNYPNYFIRHRNAEVWLDSFEDTADYRTNATWHIAAPLWKSEVILPLGSLTSIRVTTPGFTDRYLRHFEDLGFTEIVDANSDQTLKLDASFRIVAGLADSSCYSFESLNYPGSYLRHAAFRIRRNFRDGTQLFDLDATFCTKTGLSGSGVSLESFNMNGYYIRHANSEVWVSAFGGTVNPSQSEADFRLDATWQFVSPWAN